MNKEIENSRKKVILNALENMLEKCNDDSEILEIKNELNCKEFLINKNIEKNDTCKLPLNVKQAKHRDLMLELEMVKKEKFLKVELPLNKKKLEKKRISTLKIIYDRICDDSPMELIDADYNNLLNFMVVNILNNYEVKLKVLKFDKFISIYKDKYSDGNQIKEKFEQIIEERTKYENLFKLDISPEIKQINFMRLIHLKEEDVIRMYAEKKMRLDTENESTKGVSLFKTLFARGK